MRPVTDLCKIQSAFDARLVRLRRAASEALAAPSARRSAGLCFVVVEFDNLLLAALREFLISSLRQARTTTRRRIYATRIFGDEQEIGAYALSVLSIRSFQNKGSPAKIQRNDEFKVRDPRDTKRVLDSCSASNSSSLDNALALNTGLFSEIATVRNFYAHRNSDTWRKVQRRSYDMGFLGIKHPDEMISRALPGRPVSLLEDWFDDASLFFDEALK